MMFGIHVVFNWSITMVQYIHLDLKSLVEILIVYVKEYDKMLSTKVFTGEEFTQCKQTLAELHSAIIEKAEQEGCPVDNIFPDFPTAPDYIYKSQKRTRAS